MELMSPEILLLLVAVAALAGFVDAIAGGGGLLALPMLLWAGLPPVNALATNKLQGSFGTLTAAWHFIRHGQVSLAQLWPAVVMTFLGSAAGTLSVQHLSSDLLRQLIPWLLILFALYFLFSPRVGDLPARPRTGVVLFAVSAGITIGFYDGFFGPGAGSLFTMAFILLLGSNLTQATAGTKVLNFTSNIAALIFFAAAGKVYWSLGLAMGLAQIAGAWLGAHMVIRHGARLIRPILVLASVAISLRLLLE